MSDARNGRFEIDLDEIERQLRRSVEDAPPPPSKPASAPRADSAPKNDPLAELARIVGQDDPFGNLFRNDPARGPGHAQPETPLRPTLDPHDASPVRRAEPARGAEPAHASFASDMDFVLHGDRPGPAPGGGEPAEDLFDPVEDAYGSHDDALEADRYRPLTPPRSRKGLMVAGTFVVAAVLGTGGWLAWRDSGAKLASTGAPPVIKADNAPLKVAPENPGGMEIPDQNKQIYERGAQDGQTRVVDRQEQPIDVREAARALPPAPNAASGPGPNARAGRPNAVTSALGEPRRVRTVSVRPDGTLTNAPASPAPEPTMPMISGSLPPPVPVATIPISASGTVAAPAPTPAAPPAAPAATAAASAGGATPTAAPAPVTILPPRRPKFETRSELLAPSETGALPAGPNAGRQVASAAPEEDGLAAPAAAGRFSVQLGVRESEQEARAAFAQLARKYPDLGGRSPAIVRAEVGGKTVYRVRVGGLSREDATTLCGSLKSSGGQCFVAQN